MITLLIDTSKREEISVRLRIDNKEYVLEERSDRKKAQAVLPLVDTLLKEQKISLQDITTIEVNTGPGSFTGLRVGVAIANTLGRLLKVPINGKAVGETVDPVYS